MTKRDEHGDSSNNGDKNQDAHVDSSYNGERSRDHMEMHLAKIVKMSVRLTCT